jgi:hypothetical protein
MSENCFLDVSIKKVSVSINAVIFFLPALGVVLEGDEFVGQVLTANAC